MRTITSPCRSSCQLDWSCRRRVDVAAGMTPVGRSGTLFDSAHSSHGARKGTAPKIFGCVGCPGGLMDGHAAATLCRRGLTLPSPTPRLCRDLQAHLPRKTKVVCDMGFEKRQKPAEQVAFLGPRRGVAQTGRVMGSSRSPRFLRALQSHSCSLLGLQFSATTAPCVLPSPPRRKAVLLLTRQFFHLPTSSVRKALSTRRNRPSPQREAPRRPIGEACLRSLFGKSRATQTNQSSLFRRLYRLRRYSRCRQVRFSVGHTRCPALITAQTRCEDSGL